MAMLNTESPSPDHRDLDLYPLPELVAALVDGQFQAVQAVRDAAPAIAAAIDAAWPRIKAGGRLIVMPHADVEVIRAAKAEGLVCVPGVATVTEAFAALSVGADALKLVPAELITPPVLKAMRAVLPPALRLLPVGGITPYSLGAYRAAGAAGVGLGGALDLPGFDAAAVAERARSFVSAWRALSS